MVRVGQERKRQDEFRVAAMQGVMPFREGGLRQFEEGASILMKNAFYTCRYADVARRLVLLDNENMEELDKRLSRKKFRHGGDRLTSIRVEDYLAFKAPAQEQADGDISQASAAEGTDGGACDV